MTERRGFTYATAVTTVIANMVGTGVFTSLGFQVAALEPGAALIALWVLGGILAFSGAVCYAELAGMLRGSGGEYRYLGAAYHPLLGVLAGWTSVTVGFAAPVALAAMALGGYASVLVPIDRSVMAMGAVVLVTVIHLIRPGLGARFQVATTSIKLVLIAALIVAGLLAPAQGTASMTLDATAWRAMTSVPFATSLIYVGYAYTGWNAATYFAGEVENPERTVPRALLHGTLVVTVLYVGLNWVFLRTVPLATLSGQIEVGALSAAAIFGAAGGRLMSLVISLLLISTISAMVLAGPRVVEAMARDIRVLAPLARRTPQGLPRNAVLVQFVLTIVLILTGSFERVMAYAGFALTLVTLLTVSAVLWLRLRRPDLPRPYRMWGYPVTPLAFIGFSLWTLLAVLRERPVESLAGLATIAAGALLFAAGWRRAGAEAGDAPTS